MRSFPHKPTIALATVAEEITSCLKHCDESEAPEHHLLAAEQHILLGQLVYADEQPLGIVAQHISAGLRRFATFLEAGQISHFRDLRNLTLSSLAIGDWSTAHFFASVATERWLQPRNTALFSIMAQIQALFALLRHDRAESQRWVNASHAMAFEERPSKGMEPEIEEIQNLHHLLESLHRRDPTTFNVAIDQRANLRASSFARNGRNSPLGFLDLHGLGLCAIARDRGMNVTVSHVYLPLELLDAAAKLPRDEPLQRE